MHGITFGTFVDVVLIHSLAGDGRILDGITFGTFVIAVIWVCVAPLLFIIGAATARRHPHCRTLGIMISFTSGLALLMIPASMIAAKLDAGAASLGANAGPDELLGHVATHPAYELPRQAVAGLAALSVFLYVLLVYRRSAADRRAPADRF